MLRLDTALPGCSSAAGVPHRAGVAWLVRQFVRHYRHLTADVASSRSAPGNGHPRAPPGIGGVGFCALLVGADDQMRSRQGGPDDRIFRLAQGVHHAADADHGELSQHPECAPVLQVSMRRSLHVRSRVHGLVAGRKSKDHGRCRRSMAEAGKRHRELVAEVLAELTIPESGGRRMVGNALDRLADALD